MEEAEVLKVFISQPMRDKTDEEIKKEREAAVEYIKEKYSDRNVQIIDSFFEGAPHDAKPLWFLSKSLELLSTADLAYFIKGWNEYRGCKIEHTCATEYGIDCIEED